MLNTQKENMKSIVNLIFITLFIASFLFRTLKGLMHLNKLIGPQLKRWNLYIKKN